MSKKDHRDRPGKPWEPGCDQADLDNLAHLLYELACNAEPCLLPRRSAEVWTLARPWSYMALLTAAGLLSRRRSLEMKENIDPESYVEIRKVCRDELLPETPDVLTGGHDGALMVNPASMSGLRHTCRLVARWALCGRGPLDAVEMFAGAMVTMLPPGGGWQALRIAQAESNKKAREGREEAE